MDTTTLIAGLAQFLPPAFLVEATRRIMLGEEAERRVAEIREQAAERQRRKRASDAIALSRESRDEKEVSPDPSKKNYISQERGERLPPDWKPDSEGVHFAETAGWSEAEIATGIQRFRDYWISAAGERALACDWSARWRFHVSHYPPRRITLRSEARRPQTQRPMSPTNAAAFAAMQRLRGVA